MPSRSHARCKVCRKIIHARHRFGMCKQCSDKHYAKLSAQRKETKARQARRQAALIHVLEEGPAMPELEEAAPTGKPGRPHRGTQISEDQAVEILDAYTTTDEPVQAISARFGIKDTYIYNVLNRVGVTWRRGNPESFTTWQARQQAQPSVVSIANEKIPEDTAKALENMLKLPPKPEPVAPTPAVERRVPEKLLPRLTFVAVVSGSITLQADTMIEAIEILHNRWPALRVTTISEQS